MAHMERIWGTRSGHAAEIVENVVQYLKEHPANYQGQVDPLDETLRSLVETDEEADEYMNIVFGLCTTYERQGYIEGIKVGARLMMELMRD